MPTATPAESGDPSGPRGQGGAGAGDDDDGGAPIGAIVGGSIAGAVGVALLAALVVFLHRRGKAEELPLDGGAAASTRGVSSVGSAPPPGRADGADLAAAEGGAAGGSAGMDTWAGAGAGAAAAAGGAALFAARGGSENGAADEPADVPPLSRSASELASPAAGVGAAGAAAAAADDDGDTDMEEPRVIVSAVSGQSAVSAASFDYIMGAGPAMSKSHGRRLRESLAAGAGGDPAAVLGLGASGESAKSLLSTASSSGSGDKDAGSALDEAAAAVGTPMGGDAPAVADPVAATAADAANVSAAAPPVADATTASTVDAAASSVIGPPPLGDHA